jgi:hypothetical protein
VRKEKGRSEKNQKHKQGAGLQHSSLGNGQPQDDQNRSQVRYSMGSKNVRGIGDARVAAGPEGHGGAEKAEKGRDELRAGLTCRIWDLSY